MTFIFQTTHSYLLSLLISPSLPIQRPLSPLSLFGFTLPIHIHSLPYVLSLLTIILCHIPSTPARLLLLPPTSISYVSILFFPSPLTSFIPPRPPQVLPSVGYSEASPLSDALVDHQLSEEARGASG